MSGVPASASDDQVTLRDDGVLAVRGVLTFDTVPQVYASGADWVAKGNGPTTVDLRDVRKTDSAGLALLVEWLHCARKAGRELRFINVPEQARSLIDVSDLGRVLGTR